MSSNLLEVVVSLDGRPEIQDLSPESAIANLCNDCRPEGPAECTMISCPLWSVRPRATEESAGAEPELVQNLNQEDVPW